MLSTINLLSNENDAKDTQINLLDNQFELINRELSQTLE